MISVGSVVNPNHWGAGGAETERLTRLRRQAQIMESGVEGHAWKDWPLEQGKEKHRSTLLFACTSGLRITPEQVSSPASPPIMAVRR